VERKVVSLGGQELRSIELSDAVFGLPMNDGVVYYAINNELANARVGTACTKDRGEVHGSNRRPYSQKGTGRARQGDYKSPLYVGGGTAFGPKPRDFSFTLPKKVKRLALKTILSLKVRDGSMAIVEDFTVESGKTKDFVKKIEALSSDKDAVRTVVVLKDDDAAVKRAGRNLTWLSFLSYNRLRAHDLFYGRKIIVLESAAKSLNEFYADK
jgi:large subunit ribosomal protein L4